MKNNNKYIDELIQKHNFDKTKLLKILLEIQENSEQNYVSKEDIINLSEKLKVPLSQIHEVTTFFSAINTEPKGKYIIQLCDSTVCRLSKNYIAKDELEKELNIEMGGTTKDNLFTLEYVACFGACDRAPAMRIGKKVYGNLDKEKISKIINELRGDLNE
ncbi:NADH-quinone oxidoreductase subunit NuoE family protein [Helicovermis profundi]|uniref:NADH-quinone oxidoreductase subunit NuoE n=1 Tax=Helicovermis profundi TaxID=3065157 RepID=A0AAU9E533_9FIRM|nr:NADH-quinone oxidoreductase subunit NuoE [Clostridia bacterium S502]